MRRTSWLAVVVVGTTAWACTNAAESSTISESPASSQPAVPTSTIAPTLAIAEPEGVLWEDFTEQAIGRTIGWSNKVELADIDGDGDIDILIADGGDYESPGQPAVNQVWVNDGNAVFADHSEEVLGPTGDLARVIKARDLDGDGLTDIFVGTTYQTQSRLYLGTGGLGFEEVTASRLPAVPLSVGDAEVGDVDSDGDLDLALADWGEGSPMTNTGGNVQLWRNDGTGGFNDVTAGQMPAVAVRFSWEIEFADADNDWDLDLVVSCKQCSGSFFFVNDGAGVFADASDRMPQFPNNYDFEVIDLDDDGHQDLLTVNDGDGLREHVFRGDGSGGFVDGTADLWPADHNVGWDDNMVVVLDYDSDGDPDFIIGSLGLEDRLMVNDGSGKLAIFPGEAFSGTNTNGTLGIAVADLNADGRLDVVHAQGETATDERVFLGTGVEPDSAPPVIAAVVDLQGTVHARIHDNKTPVTGYDFQRVFISGPGGEFDLRWFGESLWRAQVPVPGDYDVCAVDRIGNQSCAEVVVQAG